MVTTHPILILSSVAGRPMKLGLNKKILFEKKIFSAEKKMEQKRSKKFFFDFPNKCGMDG